MGLLTIEKDMTAKKMGRPIGPEKVVFKRRVLPELVSMLDSVIEKGYNARTHDVVVIGDCKWAESLALKDKEIQRLNKCLYDMADKSAKAELELADKIHVLQHDLEEAESMSVEESTVYWRSRAKRCEAAKSVNIYDQETT